MEITVEGRKVNVDDSFKDLSSEAKEATVAEIAKSFAQKPEEKPELINPLQYGTYGAAAGPIAATVAKGYSEGVAARGAALANAPTSSVTVQGISPTDKILQGAPDASGTNALQREMGHNMATEQAAAKAKEGEKLVSQIKTQGGLPSTAPTNPLVNSPKMTVSPGGIAYPASEAYAAEKTAAAAAPAAQETTLAQRALQSAKGIPGNVAAGVKGALGTGMMPIIGNVAAGGGAMYQGADAANRFKTGDPIGGTIGTIGAIGSAASLLPHPATRYGGMAVGAGAAALNAYLDYLKKKHEQGAETTPPPSPAAAPQAQLPGMKDGGLVHLR